MILTNPTDDELNRAFAEKVAGWKCEMIDGAWSGDVGVPAPVWTSPTGQVSTGYFVPRFTYFMDAVLPWLEKIDMVHGIDFSKYYGWEAILSHGVNEWVSGVDQSLPRACVIALLRAHGVVVEFTK